MMTSHCKLARHICRYAACRKVTNKSDKVIAVHWFRPFPLFYVMIVRYVTEKSS